MPSSCWTANGVDTECTQAIKVCASSRCVLVRLQLCAYPQRQVADKSCCAIVVCIHHSSDTAHKRLFSPLCRPLLHALLDPGVAEVFGVEMDSVKVSSGPIWCVRGATHAASGSSPLIRSPWCGALTGLCQVKMEPCTAGLSSPFSKSCLFASEFHYFYHQASLSSQVGFSLENAPQAPGGGNQHDCMHPPTYQCVVTVTHVDCTRPTDQTHLPLPHSQDRTRARPCLVKLTTVSALTPSIAPHTL